MTLQLRDYQCEAIKACLDSDLGQIILPTGTGKSVIQSEIIDRRIAENPGFGVYAILTPRILLTNQLMQALVRHLEGVDLLTHTLHSGSPPAMYDPASDSDEYRAYVDALVGSTSTSEQDLTVIIQQARRENRPLLVCSTYDSCGKLANVVRQLGVTITQTLGDESHYIIEREYFANVGAVKALSERMHFFTATQKITGTGLGRGQDNESFYGPVLLRKTPNEMIRAGYMVPPRWHQVWTPAAAPLSSVVSQAFKEHCDHIGAGQPAKMLVCCNGTKSVEEIRNAKFLKHCKKHAITVFEVTSKFGARIDNQPVDRNEFLTRLRAHQSHAIVLHINILTEGIDVPNMTGVMFIDVMNMTRLLQSMGRATRPHPADLGLATADRSKFIKQFAWAIIVERDNDDSAEVLRNFLVSMRCAGFDLDELLIDAKDRGTGRMVTFDPTKDGKDKLRSMFSTFYECIHKIELAEHVEKDINQQLAALAAMDFTE